MEENFLKWVRTIRGDIYQINEYNEYIFYSDLLYNQIEKIEDDPMKLIQIGDYINKKQVINIIPADICGSEELSETKIFTDDGLVYDKKFDLVTKEHFEESVILIERR